MKTNILHIVIAKTWGGGEQYVYDICSEMKKQGRECFVAVDKRNSYFIDKYKEVSKVFPVNLYTFGGLWGIKKFVRMINREHIGIINCHSGHALLMCLLLKKITSASVVMFKHNALPRKRDIYHNWQMSNTDAYICVSKLVYNLQTYQLPKKYISKFYLIYNGIDINKFSKYSGENLKNKNYFIVGYAGRITKNKGIDVLIKAFSKLVKKFPNSKLKIAGSDEHSYKSVLEKMINDMHLEKSIFFCGQIDDMEYFYRSLDVFVLPSIVKESFGLVLCEAIYCGVPVITTDSGAQREILINNDYGCILKNNDDAIIEKTLEDYCLKKKIIKDDGADYISSRFSTKICVNALMDVYNKL